MAILEEEVWVGISHMNVIHYEELGYQIPRYKDKNGKIRISIKNKVLVKVSDLQESSGVIVTKICDECDKITNNQKYSQIILNRKNGDGQDRCTKCGHTFARANFINNVPYKRSLENFAIQNNMHYLINEFSNKNNVKPSKVFASSSVKYIWDCSKCNEEYEATTNSRTGKKNEISHCPYCTGRRTNIKNCLWTINPEVAKLLINPQRGYEITSGSHKMEMFYCGNCDSEEYKVVRNVVKQGFSCSKCSDGISYPEKFIINLLSQLKVDFEQQKTFKWSKNIYCENSKSSGNKRYDFYIPHMNLIIETHGSQHYKESTLSQRTLKEEQENDKLKEKIAKENDIENYITIDCRHSEFEFIKDNVIKSKLSYLFDMNSVKWIECEKFARSSLVKISCDLWNNGFDSSKRVGEYLGLSSGTIVRYLKQGSCLGWCDYDPDKERTKYSSLRGKESAKKIVQITKEGEYIKTWDSMTEVNTALGISISSISNVCKGRHITSGGFRWMFVSDYEKNKSNLTIYERKTSNKKIVKLDLENNFLEEFDSITKASNKLGLGISNLTGACRGRQLTCGGYKWMYANEFFKENNGNKINIK